MHSCVICEILYIIDHVKMVKANMDIHLRDLLDLYVPVWVVQPFQAAVTGLLFRSILLTPSAITRPGLLSTPLAVAAYGLNMPSDILLRGRRPGC